VLIVAGGARTGVRAVFTYTKETHKAKPTGAAGADRKGRPDRFNIPVWAGRRERSCLRGCCCSFVGGKESHSNNLPRRSAVGAWPPLNGATQRGGEK